jgi:CRISPR-associated protein Cas2
MPPRLWIVAYDIADPKRLRKVARHLEDAGERVQKSIFEVPLSVDERKRLERRLANSIRHDEDHVLLHPVCTVCRAGTVWQGQIPGPDHEPFWIV